MAAQEGLAIQEKVSRLLNREKRKPILKPTRPLVLKDRVGNHRRTKAEVVCVTEMTAMMACWKQNGFVEAMCTSEMKAFHTCVQQARAAKKAEMQQSSTHGGHLSQKEATTLLKRFPNLTTEI
ncbi:coiled-coil-helix-coiled-coil-helix domain-containing protein 1 [Thalassophryne amazonica]|uniref:coiled-coil-helix-coiled-coil-helix domain-containing protein 1 n=1 Tax=Thalassophryne amazonica TaxID=390379 RepID=UPI00147233AA|nr:coiled-coil-helix-coiled-coil-helix domain-containing protein 1 [Thalassophryne amazonica]